MARYNLTSRQRQELQKTGSVNIVRNGKTVRVTPSMAKTPKQATLRSKKFGRQVLKASSRQTGKSDTKRDSARTAMQPGKRRSASGRVYYETRKNRSDLRGRRV